MLNRTQLLLFACAAAYAYAQSDSLSTIQQALTAKYKVSSITADNTMAITGSDLTLKKGGVICAETTNMLVLANTYKSGKIAHGLFGQMASGAAATRTFVAGEKLWVTGIEVKNKGVTFSLISDDYSGVRYRGSLTFPFSRSEPPSVQEALAMVGEVFETEEPPQITVAGNAPAVQADSGYSTAPAPAATPVQPIANWDSRYGHITNDDLERINDPTLRYDLNYMRLNPAVLDDKPVMQYFIAVNNCNHQDVARAIDNELDYPQLAAFYKAKAREILTSLPRTIADIAFDRYIGGFRQGNAILWSQTLALGEYDAQRKSFPLKYPGKNAVEIPGSLSMDSGHRDYTQTCPAATKAARAVGQYLPLKYGISVPPASYRELPMDEADARRYIDATGPQRNVFLAVDIAILDSAPTINREKTFIRQATFRAKIVRVRVIDGPTQKPLGALFDDGTLASEDQIARAPVSSPVPTAKTGPANWAFGDHMYDIRMSVYVQLAADACGWPITDEQSANLKNFLYRVSNGYFSEREQYSAAKARITNAISAQGRMNYCANSRERADFDKYAAMVAPHGPLTTSGRK